MVDFHLVHSSSTKKCEIINVKWFKHRSTGDYFYCLLICVTDISLRHLLIFTAPNFRLHQTITNLLLTEREGRTGEYWPEVVTVRTERSEVRTKTTEGQYSRVRPKQARLVSSLLYGTLFLIVKCTSGGLHLKNVRLLHPSLKFRKKFNLFSFCW